MPSEIEKFQNDLLESVRQMKRGEAVRTTQVELPEAAEARAKIILLYTSRNFSIKSTMFQKINIVDL